MRVVIATVNREQGSTGVHTHTRSLRDGLVAAAASCDVVTPFDGSRAWLPIFAVRPLVLNRVNPTWATLWYRHWHGAAVRANLRRRLASGPVDQIIAQCPVSAAAAIDVAGGVPVTMVCHFNHSEAAEYRDQGVLAGDDRYRRMLAAEDDVLRRVDRVVYVSEWAKGVVERERGVTPRASAVVRNGIAEHAAVGTVTRADLGVSADDVVLMSVGTLEPRKNQLALVDRMPSLHAKLVLVGDGPDRAKIESRVAELGLTGRVVLLGHRRDVAALLPLADVYVHSALAENCPVSVIEAARAGLPWAAVPAAGVIELQRELGGCVSLDEVGSLVSRRDVAAAAGPRGGGGVRLAVHARGDGPRVPGRGVVRRGGGMTVLSYETPVATPRRRTLRDGFVTMLAVVLLGYALCGRGFAYVGAPPLFIGEITLGCGLVAFSTCRRWRAVLGNWRLWPLLALCAWGLVRTLPFVSADPVNAIRDGVVWGYGTFAVVMAAVVVDRPAVLVRVVRLYRRFVRLFAIGIPVAFVLYHFAEKSIPKWPWAGTVGVVQVKEGDALVHLGGCVAFLIAALGGPVSWAWVAVLTLDAGAMGVIDRAGMVAFGAVFTLSVVFRPRSRVIRQAVLTVVVTAVLLWATNLSIPVPGGKGRVISFDQQIVNLTSTFTDSGNDGLDSNKEWRLNWWKEIRRYTFHGPYFWKGKGFGINLADDDGYQVLADHSLRNPHSVHMTMLARGGVPMLALWAAVQLTFAATVATEMFRARRARQPMWEGLFFFLGVYWLAFLINGSFDVFLEGPMGGIWFWSVYGTGIGASLVHRREGVGSLELGVGS